MLFRILPIIGAWLLDLLAMLSRSDHDKDLELLILRHQIGILNRNVKRPKASRLEKLGLALLTHRLQERSNASYRQLRRALLDLHAENRAALARRTGQTQMDFQTRTPTRPTTHFSRNRRAHLENGSPDSAAGLRQDRRRIAQVGIRLSQLQPSRSILRRHGIPPAPDPRQFILAYISQPLQRPDARL